MAPKPKVYSVGKSKASRIEHHSSDVKVDAVKAIALKFIQYKPQVPQSRVRIAYHLRSRSGIFPFLKLPFEIRLKIYSHLTTAEDKLPTYKKAVEHKTASGKPLGKIRINQLAGREAKLALRSSRPSLTFLRTCQQIYREGTQTIYENNVFEVTARKKTSRGLKIFALPGGLQLSKVRWLRLITASDVGYNQGCNTWSVLRDMPALRELHVAMKTPLAPERPDFMSCLETMDILIWLHCSVKVSFDIATELPQYYSTPWLCKAVMEGYVQRFNNMRGFKLGHWTPYCRDTYLLAVRKAEKDFTSLS